MRNRRFIAATLAIGMTLGTSCPAVSAETPSVAPLNSEQQEADYRVIAARCGTPAFEKAFTRQSKALVAARMVSPNRDALAVERSITALRRSPLTLVAASTDCPAQLAQLADLQKQRSSLVKPSRRSAPKP
jgi:hypothetical protein